MVDEGRREDKRPRGRRKDDACGALRLYLGSQIDAQVGGRQQVGGDKAAQKSGHGRYTARVTGRLLLV